MQDHGIVNGHWEPTERHSRLLELVRFVRALFAKKVAEQQERDSQREQRRADWAAAGE